MAINPVRSERVAVIGSGLGGLSAAISLAIEGFRVTVFEKNEKAGGKLNLLRKEGFNFDLGPSILTMPHIFQTLFAMANKKMSDYVEIQEVKPHWRNFFEDGTVIDLTPDLREMEKELAKLSQNEADGFFEYLDYSRRLCKITEEGYFAKGLETA
jgi:diapolycopene oxygenase